MQIFLVAVWNFELYMLPVALLLVFVKNLVIVHVTGNLLKEKEVDVSQRSQWLASCVDAFNWQCVFNKKFIESV